MFTVTVYEGTITALKFLHPYRRPQAVAKNEAEAQALLCSVGGRQLAEAKIDAVMESSKTSLGLPQIAAENETLGSIAEEVVHCHQLKSETEKNLRKRTKKTAAAKSMTKAVEKQPLGSLCQPQEALQITAQRRPL